MIIIPRPPSYDRLPYAERMALIAKRARIIMNSSFQGWSIV